MEIGFKRPASAARNMATACVTNPTTRFSYQSLYRTLGNPHDLRSNAELNIGAGVDANLAVQRQYVFVPELAIKQLNFLTNGGFGEQLPPPGTGWNWAETLLNYSLFSGGKLPMTSSGFSSHQATRENIEMAQYLT